MVTALYHEKEEVAFQLQLLQILVLQLRIKLFNDIL